MRKLLIAALAFLLFFGSSCQKDERNKSAQEILGKSEYLAMSYGGYREKTREDVPSVEDLKEDLKVLSALGVKVIRTYNTQQFAHANNLVEAIKQLKDEDKAFEMYVMLGAWIDCKGAWGPNPDHELESEENNKLEVDAAVKMAQDYPDIVKMIAVGNEAMVHWAASYFVRPGVILKWVNYLQNLKTSGELAKDVWITSSDNFASWGGGDESYHLEDLNSLIKAVDFLSVHTYPFHDSHYQPDYWGVMTGEEDLSKEEQIELAMKRAQDYAKTQYGNVLKYLEKIGVEKPVHIGETGWASLTNSMYGAEGTKAADEYKEKLYYDKVRAWTNAEGISCFYFEAFDEQWKDGGNPLGSENHFGLINLQSQAKYTLWDEVDKGIFEGLERNGKPITKTYGGDFDAMMKDVLAPPYKGEAIIESDSLNADNSDIVD
ncbi:MAG: glycosyl hydrolase family 17 [Bacteroidia bacterium]